MILDGVCIIAANIRTLLWVPRYSRPALSSRKAACPMRRFFVSCDGTFLLVIRISVSVTRPIGRSDALAACVHSGMRGNYKYTPASRYRSFRARDGGRESATASRWSKDLGRPTVIRLRIALFDSPSVCNNYPTSSVFAVTASSSLQKP